MLSLVEKSVRWNELPSAGRKPLLHLPDAIIEEREQRLFVLGTDRAQVGREALAIGTEISRLHREHFGRGATTTRTVYQRDYVIAFLEDIFTPAERTLIDAGNHEDVKRTRQALQMAMREQFCEAVERKSGRKVIAFMSQVHFEPDLAAEIFVLEPHAEDGRRERLSV